MNAVKKQLKNIEMLELHNCRYQMQLSCCGDTWRLNGLCPEHPSANEDGYICPSTPIHLDEENLILTTASGRKYKLSSFINKEDVIQQIKSDIKNNGYEVH